VRNNLPLVDYEFGLSQLGGNAQLLNKMLGKFKAEFASVPAYIKNKVNEGDLDAAKMKVHTAKGITGNLGLRALFENSKALEAELKQGNSAQALMQEFAELMQASCNEIDICIAGISTPEQSTPHTIVDAKEKLRKLLSRHEFIDDGLLRDLIASIDMSEDDKKQLIEMIEQLQYEQALAMIKR
jgi:HPt (histidine-containing phosphotransfer) domain-containing protein